MWSSATYFNFTSFLVCYLISSLSFPDFQNKLKQTYIRKHMLTYICMEENTSPPLQAPSKPGSGFLSTSCENLT